MSSRTAKEGRVNVPLGKWKKALQDQAKKNKVTETLLARALVVNGLSRMATGEFKFEGPTITDAETK